MEAGSGVAEAQTQVGAVRTAANPDACPLDQALETAKAGNVLANWNLYAGTGHQGESMETHPSCHSCTPTMALNPAAGWKDQSCPAGWAIGWGDLGDGVGGHLVVDPVVRSGKVCLPTGIFSRWVFSEGLLDHREVVLPEEKSFRFGVLEGASAQVEKADYQDGIGDLVEKSDHQEVLVEKSHQEVLVEMLDHQEVLVEMPDHQAGMVLVPEEMPGHPFVVVVRLGKSDYPGEMAALV